MIDPILTQGLCELGLALIASAVITLIGRIK